MGKNNLIDELNDALTKAGVPTNLKYDWSDETLSPLSALCTNQLTRKPFVKIILEFANKLQPQDKFMIVGALTEKGNYDAVPFLLSLFHDYSSISSDLWSAGYALYVIDDKTSYQEILLICQDKTKGSARQMLMGTLARMKSKEAYKALIDSLNDWTVRGHAIEALGRFGNIEAIQILEALDVKKGLYEYRARLTALKRLKRKLEGNCG